MGSQSLLLLIIGVVAYDVADHCIKIEVGSYVWMIVYHIAMMV